MLKKIIFILTINIFVEAISAYNVTSLTDVTEYFNYTQILTKCGYNYETYKVTTKDGYILTVLRIPGNISKPVLLQHGVLDSSDTFVVRCNKSLAITLANNDYDVWLGNIRGNKYSRNHTTLNPDTDNSFWQFSMDEFGKMDLPATIDFILNKTGQSQLQAIGHSEGTSDFYVLGASSPEYNDKIKIFISLAPVAYLTHLKGILVLLAKSASLINAAFELLHQEEVLQNGTVLINFIDLICSNSLIASTLCDDLLIGPAVGIDDEEIEDFNLFSYFPAGTGKQNLLHYVQIYNTGRFAAYDYGTVKNLELYNSSETPIYNLTKVTMPIALLVGKNDFIATVEDVLTLKSALPNVVCYQEVDREKMNHIDFTIGEHMHEYLFPIILDLLEQYL